MSSEATSLAHRRLHELLDELLKAGQSQQQVAHRVGLAPQHLSNLKAGTRSLSELLARRFEEAYGVSHRWLLGESDHREVESGPLGSLGMTSLRYEHTLPLFEHPIVGDPFVHAQWDGSSWEPTPFVYSRLVSLTWPYLLRLGVDDHEGQWRRGSILLMAQDVPGDAHIVVVCHRRKYYLARRRGGQLLRVAHGKTLPPTTPLAGHVVAVVWAELT